MREQEGERRVKSKYRSQRDFSRHSCWPLCVACETPDVTTVGDHSRFLLHLSPFPSFLLIAVVLTC